MHELLMDFIFDLSEAQQALIMFGSMVFMIVLAVPIPIAVAIGTVIGYFMMDLNLVCCLVYVHWGGTISARDCAPICLCRFPYGARWNGKAHCKYGSIDDR